MADPTTPFLSPSAPSALRAADTRFDAWMRGAALPYWCSVGHDGPGRGFVEQLDLDATPSKVAFKRVRAQARQIYVYSHAATIGFGDGLAQAADGWDFLRRHAWHQDGGWVRRVGRDGGVIDPVMDLYDNAFVMLSLAWHAKATGQSEPIDWAHRTLDAIEARMTLGDSKGYANWVPTDTQWRQQNPHMHLLEAMLALTAITGQARFRAVALDLVELALSKFFDPATGTLAEFFTPDWQRAPAPDGTRIEPGHQFEWVWLLWQAQSILGVETAGPAKALYSFGRRFGADPSSGLTVDAVTVDGGPLDPKARLWPQTEALKAHLAMGGPDSGAAIQHVVDGMLNRYLAVSPPGVWMDQFDTSWNGISTWIPASSLYHLFVAYAELHRLSAPK